MKEAIRQNDVYKFSYSPKKEWGFDARYHCFEGYLIASAELDLVDTYWGVLNSSGRVLDMARIEEEVRNGGSFTFYFNINDVELIRNSEAIHYADTDLFHISEQHACAERCRYTYKRKGAERNATKMLETLREYLREAKRQEDSAVRAQQRLVKTIEAVENGDLTVDIFQ